MKLPEEKRTHRLFIWVLAASLSVCLIVFGVIRLVFPKSVAIPTTGPYAVATALYTYVDQNRLESYSQRDAYRKVNVEFWYPDDGNGVFPLVVFSHGALGIRQSNESLYRELASHGYVVGALDHRYQALWASDESGKITLINFGYLSDLQREDARTDKQQSFLYYQHWMQVRMGDINFILDTIVELAEKDTSGVFQQVDTRQIGVMGHSLGGAAALGVGRQREDVLAVIALEAPYLFDILGVDNGEFVFDNSPYPIPVLNIYSDDSWGHLAEWPQYGVNNALLSGDYDGVYNVHISGIGHLALTDLVRTSPILANLLDRTLTTREGEDGLRIINQLSLAFFNPYLKGEGDFLGLQE
jgi:dienelactone hydrolase